MYIMIVMSLTTVMTMTDGNGTGIGTCDGSNNDNGMQ